MRQCVAIHVFQFSAHRHAVRDARDLDALPACNLRKLVSGRLTLNGGISGNDHFFDLTLR